MSFLLTCPNCGVREVTDFGYGGEVTARPTSRRSGCRAWFLAERDTRTNVVEWTALPGDAPEAAPAGGDKGMTAPAGDAGGPA